MPYFFGYDSTFFLMIPALILAAYAQAKVTSVFRKYSTVASRRGMTGAEAARFLLERSGVTEVVIEHTHGSLSDHYDPRTRTLRLSNDVYGSSSIAALGVAAHETGHAIQHELGYTPLAFRNSLTPVASFGNKLAFPLIALGFALYTAGSFGPIICDIGIIMFSLVVLFQLVTLPVEFDASGRAIELLRENNLLAPDELEPAKKVLKAAALTYIAAAATSIINLLRLMLLSRSRKK